MPSPVHTAKELRASWRPQSCSVGESLPSFPVLKLQTYAQYPQATDYRPIHKLQTYPQYPQATDYRPIHKPQDFGLLCLNTLEANSSSKLKLLFKDELY